MKKLFVMALMLITSIATTYAADSEALKAILKAKTYDEAASILNSSAGQLANAVEKAKAYNKLVDLAMVKVNKETQRIADNNLAVQFGQGKVQLVDTLGLYKGVYNAILNAIECEKFDQMADDKGKVKPKFHEANQKRLYNLRGHLINAGINAQQSDAKEALRNYGLYVESASSPLFAELIAQSGDENLGEVARVASIFALQEGDAILADRYVDIAMKDPQVYKDAINLKVYIAQQQLKSHEDSLAYVGKLRDLYVQDKSSDYIFGQLASLYESLNDITEVNKLIDDKLSVDPNNYTAWAMKGQRLMNENKLDEAIECYQKAIAAKEDDALARTYLGFCLLSKASLMQSEKEQRQLVADAVPYLEKARELDPNRQTANWGYPLYRCYYILYGENDARTQEMMKLN